MITNQIPARFLFVFKKDGFEYHIYDKTEEQARKQLSFPEQFVFLRKEVAPFRHQDFATKLGMALAGEWTVKFLSTEQTDSGFYLIRADGLTIFASAPNYSHKDKWKFHLSRPRYNDRQAVDIWENGNKVESPSIGVNTIKSPEQIAKDIERRLFPEAERIHRLCLEKLNKINEAERLRNETIKAFCAIAEIPVTEDQAQKIKHSGYLKNIEGEWEVRYDGFIELKLPKLSLEQVKKVLNALK